jgi:hypothetical protein
MMVAMTRTDLGTAEGVASMITLSVRCAVPLLYLAFAASSIRVLFPGPYSLWLLRNRKIFGLSFAAAMAWQALFIVWLTTVHRDYYITEVYVLRDVIEGVIGYAFLSAMTLTSFPFGRKRITPRQWKLLHKAGIYSLWVYAFGVYWWELYYYPHPDGIDYIYYWSGFLAWGLRAAAWRKKRMQASAGNESRGSTRPVFVAMGLVLIGLGLIVASAGLTWQPSAEEFLTGYTLTRWPELYLPYWPFEPYFPVFIIAFGVWLMTKNRSTDVIPVTQT